MRDNAVLDVSGLTRFASRKHPLWWGIAFLVTIEMMVTANLIVSYLYLAALAPSWPPEGVPPPDLLWASINLVLLLFSAFTMWWAGWGIDRDNRTILTLGTGLSVLLAGIVLALRWINLADLRVQWDDGSYGAIVWAITGFHFIHVASALLGTAVVTLLSWMGYFTKKRQLGVVVDTLYWYFVAGIWIPFYVVLYWVPRLI